MPAMGARRMPREGCEAPAGVPKPALHTGARLKLFVDDCRDRKNSQQCQADFDAINTSMRLAVSNPTIRLVPKLV